MGFLIEKLDFLGLNSREVRVFTALATFGRMNMTKVASRSGLSRTTVDAIVRRLLKQGVISKERVRGHYEYFVNTEEVANTLDWIEKRFRPNTNVSSELSGEKKEEGNNDAIKNIDENIVKETKNVSIYEDISKEYKGDRVRILFSRGYKDIEDCIERFIEYVQVSLSYNFKLEVLLSASIADALIGRDDIPTPSRDDSVRLNVVPTVYSTGMHDMFIFRDRLILINTQEGKREHITHETIVETSKHLIEIACETGWSVDLVAWLNRAM